MTASRLEKQRLLRSRGVGLLPLSSRLQQGDTDRPGEANSQPLLPMPWLPSYPCTGGADGGIQGLGGVVSMPPAAAPPPPQAAVLRLLICLLVVLVATPWLAAT